MLTATVIRRVKRRLPKLQGAFRKMRAKVGFPAGETDQAVIRRAVFNNFGNRGGASGGGWGGPIPERPFMQNAARQNRDKYKQLMGKLGARILLAEGRVDIEAAAEAALRQVAIKAQGDIQKEITDLHSPPNSPVTVALKGSSNPLIASGEMRSAVTFKIEKS